MKYCHYFKEQVFQRTQVVQKEGEPLDNLYLIIEGEFELSKTIVHEDDEDNTKGLDLREYLPHTKHKLKPNQRGAFLRKCQKKFSKEKTEETVRVGLVYPYTFVGLSEVTGK